MKLPLVGFAVLFAVGAAVVTSDELDSAFQKLKDAESQKDPAQVKEMAVAVCSLARQVIATPAPGDAAEKEAWTSRANYAKDLALRSEYALSVAALQGPPAVTVDLFATLEQQNPRSKYLADNYAFYLYALHQTGASAKILPVAEKAIVNFPENEDLLLVLADNAMTKKQANNALAYARRLIAAFNKHAKPENVAAADWTRKKNAAMGHGYWIAGMVLSEQSQHFEADRNLRAALPLIKGNEAMMAPALYYLGVANFQLGKLTLNKARVLEAVAFSEQSAAIAGPYQQTAWHNALVMKQEAGRMR